MNTDYKQIAQRIVGLRDAVEATQEDFAAACGISLEDYQQIEAGAKDVSVSALHCLAKAYNVPIATIMFGDEPHAQSYSLVRKDNGASVERFKAYKYEALATTFANRAADPFIVTVEPDDSTDIHTNSHAGQEFNLIMEGELLLIVDGKEIVMHPGDSIYFDATRPHGMKALNGSTVRFLAIII